MSKANRLLETGPEQLWARISSYSIGPPDAALSFRDRLARENGWTRARADRVIAEYKRFAFLAMTAGHEVTPSDAVDQAWHLHLTYSRDYWERFCPDILGAPLHHGPTRGGAEEQHRFHEQYAETLRSYEAAFGLAIVGVLVQSNTLSTRGIVIQQGWDGFKSIFNGDWYWLPAIVALVIAMPCLTIISNFAALGGAIAVAYYYSGISTTQFIDRLHAAVDLSTIFAGLIKAPFMAMIIGIIGSVEGLKVGGSAESLGLHVTASVVKSIFVVILVDGFFAIFYAAIGF